MQEQIVCRVITGPTGSGKSRIAMQLAEKSGWDILCMDSMQIYRRMNIGTDKPTEEDRFKVTHHLIDICEPSEPFSVSMYAEEAVKKIRSLHQEGKEFVFVGGTGLYLEALMKPMGMGFIPANESLRTELHQIADAPDGKKRLDERLRKIDPDTADKLPLNDIRRRIRAIEVSELTGIPFSRQPASNQESMFQWRAICISPERSVLYDRINRRVYKMIENGLEKEVKSLLSEGIGPDAQSMQAIGYKEMIPYLHGEYSLDRAIEMIQTGTRHYAKRQITFFKRFDQLQYIDPAVKDAERKIAGFLKGTGGDWND